MIWERSYRADPRALPLADRHYTRQTIGSPQFVPPGRCVVLLTPEADALWVTSWPYGAFVQHAWPGAWVCSLFRNEAGHLSSDLIVEAVAVTRYLMGDPPPLGMVTFFDPARIPGFFRRTANGTVLEWGYYFWRAGFEYAGWTKGGLFARRLAADAMPMPRAPRCELALWGAA